MVAENFLHAGLGSKIGWYGMGKKVGDVRSYNAVQHMVGFYHIQRFVGVVRVGYAGRQVLGTSPLLVNGDDTMTNMDAIPFSIGDSAVCVRVFGGRVKL